MKYSHELTGTETPNQIAKAILEDFISTASDYGVEKLAVYGIKVTDKKAQAIAIQLEKRASTLYKILGY